MWRANIALFVMVFLFVCGSTRTAAAQAVNPPQGPDINAVPFEFDPGHLNVVAAEWKGGIGCAPTDPCGNASAGDPQDSFGVGLLLAKTGTTGQFASAGVTLTGTKGITLTELGYDLRKPLAFTDPRGSHCGAGAPRFNITTSDGVTHFIGCASPPPTQDPSPVGLGWIRLRWLAPLTTAFPPVLPGSTIVGISIVFDEGTDTGPDNFGLAVLDNIDVNGQLIGNGPRGPAK